MPTPSDLQSSAFLNSYYAPVSTYAATGLASPFASVTHPINDNITDKKEAVLYSTASSI